MPLLQICSIVARLFMNVTVKFSGVIKLLNIRETNLCSTQTNIFINCLNCGLDIFCSYVNCDRYIKYISNLQTKYNVLFIWGFFFAVHLIKAGLGNKFNNFRATLLACTLAMVNWILNDIFSVNLVTIKKKAVAKLSPRKKGF